MHPISLPVETNAPPNNAEASLITIHNNGRMTTSIINASKMQKSILRIPPISQIFFISYHKPLRNHTPHSVLLFGVTGERTYFSEYKSHIAWRTHQ